MNLRTATVGALLLTLIGCTRAASSSGEVDATAGAGKTTTAHMWHMHKVTFTDPGFSNPNAPAGTLLVPADWQVRANGFYLFDCVFSPPGLKIVAGPPDGSIGTDVYPGQVEAWSDNPNLVQSYRSAYANFKGRECQVRPTPTLATVLHTVAEKLSLQADGGILPIPKLDDELRANVAKLNAQLAQQPNGGSVSASGGRIRFHGSPHGKPVDGWLNIILATRSTPLPQGGHVYLTKASLVALIYAPPGQLEPDENMLTAILGTIQPDAQWLQAVAVYAQQSKQTIDNALAQVAQIHNEMAMDNLRTQQKIAAIHRGTAAYASQVYSTVARDRSVALDHSAQQFSLYMGDQAVYRNPQTGERVQLSSSYGHAWASSTGNSNDYVLTDSASFNPNGNIGNGGWTELQEER